MMQRWRLSRRVELRSGARRPSEASMRRPSLVLGWFLAAALTTPQAASAYERFDFFYEFGSACG